MALTVIIRVDRDVYDTILARKGEIEREQSEVLSMNDALRDLLHLDPQEGVTVGAG